MSMILDKIKQALAVAYATSVRQSAPAPAVASAAYARTANPNLLAEQLLDYIKRLYEDPSTDKVVFIRGFLYNIKSKYGYNVYSAVMNILRNKLFNTPYIYVLKEVTASKDPVAVVSAVRGLKTKNLVAKLASITGIPEKEVASVVGATKAETEEKLKKRIAEKIYELLNMPTEHMAPQSLRASIEEIKKLWKIGSAVLRGEINSLVPEISNILKKYTAKTVPPSTVYRIIRTAVSGDVEDVQKVLLSYKAAPVKMTKTETVKKLRSATATSAQEAVDETSRRMSNIMASAKAG